MAPQTVVQLNASTITLTTENFSIWRKHVQSTLIGMDLVHFITGTKTAPAEFPDSERTKPNPDYYLWYWQD
ncbi:hypothetical protein HanRHA438_Chr05g0215301 [Helianthus annuus]|nr:hypothetical protein HanRHA438_Chr05g0215301 [Helianthus annuus]